MSKVKITKACKEVEWKIHDFSKLKLAERGSVTDEITVGGYMWYEKPSSNMCEDFPVGLTFRCIAPGGVEPGGLG